MPEQVGAYRIIRLLGVGGMGEVYEAEQARPKRIVALKVVKAGMVSQESLRRFEMEAEVLGRLRHPGVAQVFEAGTAETAAGTQPYFAMELIRGQPLIQYADAHGLDLHQRMALLVRICEAVHYAHQQGIIHRDLKPSNILVDDAGQPKILDFGIAKATDSDVQAMTLQTDLGQIIGTLEYMSPEQAAGDPKQVDTRTDVYALGVIAYELLSGKLPLELKGRMLVEAVRAIQQDEPGRLSSLNRKLRGDLETIVGKALEKEKTRRYQSANELASDLKRYLGNEPIAARPPGTWYQARKFVQRNKLLAGATLVVFVVLVLGVIATSWQAVRATNAQRLAVQQKSEADAARQAEAAQRALAEAAAEQSKKAERMAELRAAEGLVLRADALVESGRYGAAGPLYRQARDEFSRLSAPVESADLGLWSLHRQACPPLMRLAEPSGMTMRVMDVSADGSRVLAAGPGKTLLLVEPRSGRIVQTLALPGPCRWAALSPDARWAATGADGAPIRLWDTKAGLEVGQITGQGGGAEMLVFSPDSRTLYCAGWEAGAKLSILATDVATRKQGVEFDGPAGGVWSGALFPAGDRLACCGYDGEVRVWSTATGKPMITLAKTLVRSMAASPDGRLVAGGNDAGKVTIWDSLTGEEVRSLAGHKGQVASLAFSPDGRWLLSGDDQVCRLWDTTTWRRVRLFGGHQSAVTRIAFLHDGRRFVTFGSDATYLWDIHAGLEARQIPAPVSYWSAVAYSPDGRLLAAAGNDGSFALWEPAVGKLLRSTPAHKGGVTTLAWSPDGLRLATGKSDGDIDVWNVADNRLLQTLKGCTQPISRVAFSPDGGRLIAACQWDHCSRIWDIESGKLLHTISDSPGLPISAEFFRDGDRVVVTNQLDRIRTYNARTGAPLAQFDGTARFNTSALSPDQLVIASGMAGPGLQMWDVAKGGVVANAPASDVRGVAFSPNSRWLATADFYGGVSLWAVPALRELCALDRNAGTMTSIHFNPDGMRLAAGGNQYVLRLWDLGLAAWEVQAEAGAARARKKLVESPDDAASLLELGRWHARKGVDDWAVDYFERARKAGAKVPAVALAQCHWRLDRDEEALAEFRRAAAEAGDDSERRHIDLCVEALGRKAEAKH
ncbi:MAG: protein kinase [Planctomycetota bacterium]|nr:protein kinase [Planctomycetota bacterium]